MPPSKPTRPGHAPSRGPKHPTAPLRIDRAHACLRGVSRPHGGGPKGAQQREKPNQAHQAAYRRDGDRCGRRRRRRCDRVRRRARPGTGDARDAADSRRQRRPRQVQARLLEAEKYGIAPKRNLARVAPASPDIGERAAVLKVHVVGERGRRKVREELKPEFGTPESLGVSQGTLDSIASCESGGDPTAVDASGTYYGKYQFDTGTWASVGGSGSPAAASEAEQDYRAALLYSRAGSSPWPVCGS